jgi:hypothetical protein
MVLAAKTIPLTGISMNDTNIIILFTNLNVWERQAVPHVSDMWCVGVCGDAVRMWLTGRGQGMLTFSADI